MNNEDLIMGLRDARKMLAERVPVILSWTAVKALDEAIRRMERKQAEVA